MWYDGEDMSLQPLKVFKKQIWWNTQVLMQWRYYWDAEKDYYITYTQRCALVCSILNNSLSLEIRLRIDSNPAARQAFGFGQLRQFWFYISEVVRETGQNWILPTFN